MILKLRHYTRAIGAEAIIWTCALAALALVNPDASLYSICPLKNLGITWCPGCGLGRSVVYAFRGQVLQSLRAHILGIPVAAMLLTRILTLLNNARQYHRTLSATN